MMEARTFVRTDVGPRVSERIFGPKTATHPSIGDNCPGCTLPFKVGDMTVLVIIGPGMDTEAAKRLANNRFYNAVAVEVHATCAGVEYHPEGP